MKLDSVVCVVAGAALVGLLAPPSLCADEVRVEIHRIFVSGTCDGTTTTYTYDEGEAIVLTGLPPCTFRVNIYAIPNTTNIGSVSLSGTGSSWVPSRLQILIGSGAFPSTGGQTTQACGDFGGLSIGDSNLLAKTDLAGYIGGDLTGSISVNTLYRLDVEGQIQDDISVTNAAPNVCRIVAGSSTSAGHLLFTNNAVTAVQISGNCAGDIRSTNSNFTLVEIGGNLTGILRSENGRIETVDVTGNIGSIGSPTFVQAMDGIFEIKAAAIYATVAANYNSGTGSLYRLETTSGDFAGSLNCRYLTTDASVSDERLEIAGDLAASITTTEDIRIPIHADGDITGNITIANNLFAGTSSAGEITAGGDITGTISITNDLRATTTQHALISAGGSISGNISVGGDIQAATGHAATIQCGGNLNANVTVTDKISGRILIGGSLNSGKTISAQALMDSGANGQVIINRANSSGTWAGSVVINGTTLATAPYYATTGLGGAVGLAPFQCHLEDCSPVNLSRFTSTWNSSTDRVRLRHYGPITWTGKPVTVSWCSIAGDCTPGSNDDTANWSVDGSPTTGGRDLLMQYTGGTLPADRHFHFIPVRTGSNMLKSADLTAGGDVPVGNYTYTFSYEP